MRDPHHHYDPSRIEPAWRARWRDAKLFEVRAPTPDERKAYVLEMLPYPSGRIHMGHVRNYAIGDVLARFHRMRGKHVLHPMGWDAFGLPAENAAIERGMHPDEWTRQNIAVMRSQLAPLGFSYDASREITTCDPAYYRWGQLVFTRMLRAGLAYRKHAPVNWCPRCETVLANEQAEGGACWRCGSNVETRELEQWFIRITRYAEELRDGLDSLKGGWPDHVLSMQRHWIAGLRDWLISRQRYWGCPIPVVYGEDGVAVPVPDEELPVVLPRDVALTGEGGSPLARSSAFVSASDPRDPRKKARRETDTFDTFWESSWYFLRYLSPTYAGGPVDPQAAAAWMPVDQYVGGVEHAVMHLLYARFFHRALIDLGLLPRTLPREPFARLLSQGMVCMQTTFTRADDGTRVWLYPEEVAPDGTALAPGYEGRPTLRGRVEKMSKSKKNVVDPDAMVAKYGADAVRLFVLFAAPPSADLVWSEEGIEGVSRFLHRAHRVVRAIAARAPGPPASASPEALALLRRVHRTIRSVTRDVEERAQLNTAIASLMELVHAMAPLSADASEGDVAVLQEAADALVHLLSPFAPHLADELYASLGGEGFLLERSWPIADETLIRDETVELPVQINGKVRGRVRVGRDADEGDVVRAALAAPCLAVYLEGRTPRRIVYAAGRMLSLVVDP